MASSFKTEKAARISAIEAARQALLDRAEKDPVRTIDGFIKNPHLITGKIQDFNKIVKILLEKGQMEKLQALSRQPQISPYAKNTLMKVIINETLFKA